MESKGTSFAHDTTVHDIAWASLNGRSCHLIATCSVKGLFLWKIDHSKLKASNPVGLVKDVICLNDRKGAEKVKVLRVQWNIIGTILVSSGEDNEVKVWKGDYNQNWSCVSKIKDLQEGNNQLD